MGATPYVSLGWTPHEVVTKDKMDAVQANMQWMLDNTPRSRYTDYKHIDYDSDIVIMGGRVLIPRNKYSHRGVGHVRFGTAFEPGYLPNISTSVCSDQKKSVFCTVRGMNNSFNPDYRGFDVEINVPDISARPKTVRGKKQKDRPDRTIWVMWQAMGIRRTS